MAGRPRKPDAGTAILAAATAILGKRGYDGLSLDEVARLAGVGKSSLYARFPAKAELAVAALASLQRDGPGPSGDLREDLIVHLRSAEHDLGLAGPEALGTVLGLAAGRAADSPLASRVRQLGRLLERARERGELGPGVHTEDTELAVATLLGALLVRLLLPSAAPEPWPQRSVDAALSPLER